MADINYKDRTINARIVYYGPGMSGKTTNIQVLHEHARPTRRGHLVSVDTAQDRTIMFDLLPLKIAAFHGLDLKVHLVAVPGQTMYAAVRRLALRDVDAVVFVANSAPKHQDENSAALAELIANLSNLGSNSASMPLVLQYNKRDLPDALPIASMDRTLNARRTISQAAVAIRGEGVLETFAAILTLTVQDLARRYHLAEVGIAEPPQEWSAGALREVFGTSSLALPDSAEGGAAAERRTVHLELPVDVVSGERRDARTNEALVESYAEAAVALTEDAQRLRDERDQAQRRLADVLGVLETARMLAPGRPQDPLVAAILDSLAREVDTLYASVLIRASSGDLMTAALRGLSLEPLLAHAQAVPLLQEFQRTTVPKWHDAGQDPTLGSILTANDPALGSVVSVPLRTRDDTPIGLALLYQTRSASPPRWETLKQVGVLARVLGQLLDPSALGSTDQGDWDTSL
jgi:mutual gliding-motility protein MglA